MQLTSGLPVHLQWYLLLTRSLRNQATIMKRPYHATHDADLQPIAI